MKNIHLIPTDKPSSLYILGNNELKLRYTIDLPIDSDIAVNQHIYITNHEEIKAKDWIISKSTGELIKSSKSYCANNEYGKKIILTTDQNLIKDGVQAIDDEFLEWFVENPSCEEVEVFHQLHKDEPLYKIIIPSEENSIEAKQRAKNYMRLKGALEPKDVVLGYKTSLDAQMLDKIGLEEPKQEIWKDIPNYEGLYQVSNFGNVKSLKRYVKGKVEDRLQKENILSKRLVGDIGNQYYAVTLCNNKDRKQIKISVLVAMAFLNHIPNGYVGFTVDHIDNNPLNNNVNNLQVITKRENSSKDRKGISKYTGVTFNKKTNKWRSQIWINGQNKTLGSFDDELEAHRAYQKELQQHLKLQ